jgi:hypothetical protein
MQFGNWRGRPALEGTRKMRVPQSNWSPTFNRDIFAAAVVVINLLT